MKIDSHPPSNGRVKAESKQFDVDSEKRVKSEFVIRQSRSNVWREGPTYNSKYNERSDDLASVMKANWAVEVLLWR